MVSVLHSVPSQFVSSNRVARSSLSWAASFSGSHKIAVKTTRCGEQLHWRRCEHGATSGLWLAILPGRAIRKTTWNPRSFSVESLHLNSAIEDNGTFGGSMSRYGLGCPWLWSWASASGQLLELTIVLLFCFSFFGVMGRSVSSHYVYIYHYMRRNYHRFTISIRYHSYMIYNTHFYKIMK